MCDYTFASDSTKDARMKTTGSLSDLRRDRMILAGV